jgi:hypothetical protein
MKKYLENNWQIYFNCYIFLFSDILKEKNIGSKKKEKIPDSKSHAPLRSMRRSAFGG